MDVLKCGGLPLPIEEVSGGRLVALALNFRPDDHQLLRMVVGQWREQCSVIDGKDRRGRADTHRKGQQHQQGVAGKLAHHAQTVSNMLQQVPHATHPGCPQPSLEAKETLLKLIETLIELIVEGDGIQAFRDSLRYLAA